MVLIKENGNSDFLYDKNGNPLVRKYKNTINYSLDLIKLREVYLNTYRNKKFSFFIGQKEYTRHVINVTFKYAVCEWNQYEKNCFVKFGYDRKGLEFIDCLAFDGAEVVGVMVEKPVITPLLDEMLPSNVCFINGHYAFKKNPKKIYSTKETRELLYRDGFDLNGIHYVRWKRSNGSSRIGKCLFINEELFKKMRKWESCGIKVVDGQEIDLAAWESYVSLTSSGIIDTLDIPVESILVIDDYESTFSDSVVSVTEENGILSANETECEVTNSIWDGQGLIDISAMGTYSNKGMILLRNRFFKCCCFNTNLQQWFVDNNINDVSQLNGFTLANRVEDIKLITTPSSIKYLKFGTLQQWFNNIEPTFGIVKYDKGTKFHDGRTVQTHYQLINTLQMTLDEVSEFLKPSLDYANSLKFDPAVLRYHVKYPIGADFKDSPCNTKQDIVYKLLGITDKFAKTKIYNRFVDDIIRSYYKNLRIGHVFVNGNYSVLCGNPIEMLQSAIGKFNGESQMGVGNVYSKRFEFDTEILGSRSPHISMSNVWIANNKNNDRIARYMNATNQIIYINSIDENILQKLSGCDFDSDSVLITDNHVLIKAAKRNDGVFKVAVCNVSGKKNKRTYTWEQLCDLDSKTSNNLVGDIVNLSQELNTIIWDRINNGESVNDVNDIYLDVCKLNIMSGIEIDKAKKEFVVNNSKELMSLRSKYNRIDGEKRIKPKFFEQKDKGKGYYDPAKKNYESHDTSMDYIQKSISKYKNQKRRKKNEELLPFSSIIDHSGYRNDRANSRIVDNIIGIVERLNAELKSVYARDDLSGSERHQLATTIISERCEFVGEMKLTKNQTIAILEKLEAQEYKNMFTTFFSLLFGYPNKSFYQALKESTEYVPNLVRDDNGEYEIFGAKYSKLT